MNLNKNLVIESAKPYIKESIYSFIILTFVLSGVFFIFVMIVGDEIPKRNLVILIFGLSFFCYCIDFWWNYKLGVLTIIDITKKDFIIEDVLIQYIAVEPSYSGRSFKSIVRRFYPAELAVDRFKIIYKDEFGDEGMMRLVMSRNKHINIENLFIQNEIISRITYCKRSKVVIRFEVPIEEMNKLKKRQQVTINNNLNKINSQI